MSKSRLGATMGLILLSAACGKKPPPPVVPASTPPAAEADDSAARAAAAERAAREAEEARRREAEARARATLEQMIFFDYDRAGIRDDARSILDAKVPMLREDPSIRMTIEGHADERGSTEYNIALGNRRAMSVKEFLVGFGLDGSRFQVVSFGEERPLAQGSNESAWSRNRRAAFRVEGGRIVTQPTSGGR
jgi:peptidoglycan-associated lipoprotein